MCLAVHACTNVDGGAVELSWALRSSSGGSGNFVCCDGTGALNDCNSHPLVGTGPLVDIRLHWEDAATGSGSAADFKCNANHGVTGFELPPGQVFLRVTPVCGDGEEATATTYTAPAPDERTVTLGNTISLGAVVLVLEVSSCGSAGQMCICQ